MEVQMNGVTYVPAGPLGCKYQVANGLYRDAPEGHKIGMSRFFLGNGGLYQLPSGAPVQFFFNCTGSK